MDSVYQRWAGQELVTIPHRSPASSDIEHPTIFMLPFALTIFVSAFLLFLVQPIIAKLILPWFGGSAAVWSTCLVFFQTTLLAGYGYADLVTRKLTLRHQAILHGTLIAITLMLLPIVPDSGWQPTGSEQPGLRILVLLGANVGLPYFLLSATSPLLQAWFARAHPGENAYRLFALSNLASMVALLGFPSILEPNIAIRRLGFAWSIAFAAFALLIAWTTWHTMRPDRSVGTPPPLQPHSADDRKPAVGHQLTWIVLAAIASSLLLSVSNHLTQNIAAIPLVWILPLIVYLLTFILCFGANDGVTRWYPRSLWLPATALATCAMSWFLADVDRSFKLFLNFTTFSAGLFIGCIFCHGELAARKPDPKYLTRFYLMISLGGALGAVLVVVIAPLTLAGDYELGIALYLLIFVATWMFWRSLAWVMRVAAVIACIVTLSLVFQSISQYRASSLVMSRNFYGTLRVRESGLKAIGFRKHALVHGSIMHGDQYLDEPHSRSPTSYYQPTSGVGIALLLKREFLSRPLRVGVIGLGTGTLAAYGKSGDVFRFYEINPDVMTIAKRNFTYLSDSAAAIELVLGDARLMLAREPAQRFDVLAIDAFSSDSIPVHLMTLEALSLYEHHLQPDGVIAFHVSNRFLRLPPVVGKLASERGFKSAWIREVNEADSTASDWVLLSKSADILDHARIVAVTQPIPEQPSWRPWTDDFNNLLQALKQRF